MFASLQLPNTRSQKNGDNRWVFDRPYLMGVINLTPDSFYDGGQCSDTQTFQNKVREMQKARIDVIDLGAESTRPGAKPISATEEWHRIQPSLEWLLSHYPKIPLSIDTYKVEVAEKCIDLGASIINDVSAGDASHDEMLSLCAQKNTPLILMHKKGTPQTMQKNVFYQDVVAEVYDYLQRRIHRAIDCGLSRDQILVDVGIGFGKELEHNLALLKSLPVFKKLDCGILVGASRKKMLQEITHREVEDRLAGSLGVHLAALSNGCDMVRSHDVVAMRDAMDVFFKIKDYQLAHA